MEPSQPSGITPNRNGLKQESESFGIDYENTDTHERDVENGSGASIVSTTSSDSKISPVDSKCGKDDSQEVLNAKKIKLEDTDDSYSLNQPTKKEFDCNYNYVDNMCVKQEEEMDLNKSKSNEMDSTEISFSAQVSSSDTLNNTMMPSHDINNRGDCGYDAGSLSREEILNTHLQENSSPTVTCANKKENGDNEIPEEGIYCSTILVDSYVSPPTYNEETYILPPSLQSHLDETYHASAIMGSSISPPNSHVQQNESYCTQLIINVGDIHSLYTTPSKLDKCHLEEILLPSLDSAKKGGISSTKRGKTLKQLQKKKIKAKNRYNLPARKKSTRRAQSNHHDFEESSCNSTAIKGSAPDHVSFDSSSRDKSYPLDTTELGCKCSKSKCLKLYCDCFQAGRICHGNCLCRDCKNTEANSGPEGIRTKTMETILARRPDAFDERVKKSGQGCSCKKNRCLKKYCDCFNSGIECTNKCRCLNCQNTGETKIELSPFQINEDERQRYTMLHTPIKNEGISTNFGANHNGEISITDCPLNFFGNYFDNSQDQSIGSGSTKIDFDDIDTHLPNTEAVDEAMLQGGEDINKLKSTPKLPVPICIGQSNVTEV